VGLQTLENKALSRGILGKSAPTLAEITIRKSQICARVGLDELPSCHESGSKMARTGAAEEDASLKCCDSFGLFVEFDAKWLKVCMKSSSRYV
jgi:hypothetical protein